MSSLLSIGQSGLSAAQAGLNTASQNIANVNTPGYSRRTVSFSEVHSATQAGGVAVDSVRREYSDFFAGQINLAQSQLSAANAQLGLLGPVDSMLGDGSAGLAPRMQDFFDSVAAWAAAPQDAVARSAVLGDAQSLAGQFRSLAGTLENASVWARDQLRGAVAQVNTNTGQIAMLNQQIVQAQGRTGEPPNQLLDQRDQLIADTAKLVGLTVTKNDDGSVSLTVGNQALVDKHGAHALTTVADANDPARLHLGYPGPSGTVREIPDNWVGGGEIGGLLEFGTQSLAPALARLNQTAHALADAVNAQHALGTDQGGAPGGPLFSAPAPKVLALAGNGGNAVVSSAFTPGAGDQVTTDDYRIDYDGSSFSVTRLSDGSAVPASFDIGTDTLSFGGVDITITGADAGDRFLVRPLADAASSIGVAISDPSKLAAGQGGGAGDNRNASDIVALQQTKMIEGLRSLAENYAQMVSGVGARVRSLRIEADAKTAVSEEFTRAQQSISGVNLDEEYTNLMYYQQMYQANARVIQSASAVLEVLFSIAG